MDVKLGDNFNLKEFLVSNTALRMRYNEQYSPDSDVIENLKTLVDNVLQPLRDEVGLGIRVTSGYRCPRVNKRIGGSKTSDHNYGKAADIQLWINGINKTRILFNAILYMDLGFDQLIYEFGTYDDKTLQGTPDWVHVSYRKGNNRGQILRAVRGKTKTIYKRWK